MFHPDFPNGKQEMEVHLYFLLESDEDKGSGMAAVDKAIRVLTAERLGDSELPVPVRADADWEAERMYEITTTFQSCL
jgi:hypothetical protein